MIAFYNCKRSFVKFTLTSTDRHPKQCKLMEASGECNYKRCDYLHKHDIKKYKCESCKCAWENANHVVEHWIENIKLYFCLNCEDWVQHKSNVLKDGWSLFDEEGLLRRDV